MCWFNKIYCEPFLSHQAERLMLMEQRSAVTNDNGWPTDTAAVNNLNQLWNQENNLSEPSESVYRYPHIFKMQNGVKTRLIHLRLRSSAIYITKSLHLKVPQQWITFFWQNVWVQRQVQRDIKLSAPSTSHVIAFLQLGYNPYFRVNTT